ncbi:unnamed protein product [Staurois parvus]|uniref:Uncharacterized protein n=1 Tax=Staurois parvus TaxID=386267 RepID=A0ABN9AKC3_9NEOB|nr:unnamed protein product [Staurois parvus]
MAQALRGTTGSYTPGMPSGHGWSVHTTGTVQDTGGQCTQRGQFRTGMVGAHRGDSSEHGGQWLVCAHSEGTVQGTQRARFRAQVVSAHNRDG